MPKRIILLMAMICLGSERGLAQSSPGDGRSTQHIFPQFADGKFSDGSYYRSTVGLTAATSDSGTCSARLFGSPGITIQSSSGTPIVLGTLTINSNAGLGGYFVGRSTGTAAFQSGFLTLICTTPHTAQVVYSYYTPEGVKLSEATVFSSPPGTRLQIFADQRDGAQLGLAVANTNSTPVTVGFATFVGGTSAGSSEVTIPASSNYVKFLNEIHSSYPPNQLGTVIIQSTVPVAAIGLRFTGTAFTTIPVTVLQ
jgi:hypothetical protein